VFRALAGRLAGLFRLVIVLGAALAGTQLAAFMDAYEQNLSGRVDEAEREVEAIIERARQADMPLWAYLEEFQNASNPVFVREGGALQARISRAAFLADDLRALDEADVVLKPFVFLGRIDARIAWDTWERFTPAVPMSAVGLIYTGIALLVGLILSELLIAAVRAGGRPIRRLTGMAAG